MPFHDHTLDALTRALGDHERQLHESHAVYGVDALEETALHAVLARAADHLDQTVLREVLYPEHWRNASPDDPDDTPPDDTPKDSHRLRCDLVVLPPGAGSLADTAHELRDERDRLASARDTLFEPVAAAEPSTPRDPGTADPRDALWIEVKTVGQYTFIDGVPSPNRAYASRLVRGLAEDIRKLDADPAIHDAAALLVLFTQDRSIAEHDTTAALHKLLDKDLPVREPITSHVAIGDRIGNTCCTLCLFPLRATTL